MDFDFTPEQQALKDNVRRVIADLAPPHVRRAQFESGTGFNAGLWRRAAEMGWFGSATSEAYGGLGLGYVNLCAIAEELGRALAALPFLTSAVLAIEAISRAGTETQKTTWLPSLINASAVGTVAFTERPGRIRGATTTCVVENGRLSGVKVAAPDGLSADIAIVPARSGSETKWFLVSLDDPAVTRTPQDSFDPSRPVARLEFSSAPCEALNGGNSGEGLLDSLLSRAAIIASFEQLGGAEAALEMAKAYAMERHAFGRPIASFQATKHKLAEVYVSIELARSQAYYAAWALESDEENLSIAAASARMAATDAFEKAARELIQVHGGIGMTWEHDSHLFYRRSRYLALVLGSRDEWRDLLMDRLDAVRRKRNEAFA